MPDKDKLDLAMFLKDYLNDAREGFQEAFNALLALEKDHDRRELIDDIFRAVHTLKSSSTMIEFMEISETAHIAEDLLDSMKKGETPVTKENLDIIFNAVEILEDMVSAREKGKESTIDFQPYAMKIKELIANATPLRGGDEGEGVSSGENTTGSGPQERRSPRLSIEKVETVRVHVNLLDSLFNMIGELIITKNRLDNIVAEIDRKDLKAALTDMKRIIDVLQENVSTARMVSADEIFQKFPRMVRDMARDQNKEIEFVLEGNDIELDKGLIDALSEPLIHLLRNAVDHGIEPVEERKEKNKKEAGYVRLAAKRTESHILIDVEDDGRGIDIEKMKAVAVKKGYAKQEEADLMADREVFNLLFIPGFSSTENVTGVSGRGVGLDVVLTSAKKMGGMVEVSTRDNNGSCFSLRLPLTTALIQTLMVGVGDTVFAVPSDVVLETMEVRPGDIKEIGADRVLALRGEVIPFLRLDELLNMPQDRYNENQTAIIIQNADKFIAVGVDMVLNQMENIIKPFDPIARQFRGFSGGIIQGDGRVSLLLDVPELVNLEGSRKETIRHG